MKNVEGYKRLNYKEHLRLNRYYGAIRVVLVKSF